MAVCSYAVQRGDKKPDSGSSLHNPEFAGSLLQMHRWQLSTPDNYTLILCLLLPFPSSCYPQHACLGTRTSRRRELSSWLPLTTWAVSTRLDGQLHKLPYSLAGASCQGRAGPLSTKDQTHISSSWVSSCTGLVFNS